MEEDIELENFVSIKDEAQEFVNKLENKFTTIQTGFKKTDKILHEKSVRWLTTIIGDNGIGKTLYTLNVIKNLAVDKDKTVAIFSTKPIKFVMNKLIVLISKIDSKKLLKDFYSVEDKAKIIEATKKLTKSSIFVNTMDSLSVDDICDSAKNLKRELKKINKKLDLIIIDSFQDFNYSNIYTDDEEVSNAIHNSDIKFSFTEQILLSLISLSCNVPVLLVSSNKYADLKALKQFSNAVINMERKDTDVKLTIDTFDTVPKTIDYSFDTKCGEFIEK